MVNIDYIMSLIDWSRNVSEQEEGIRLAEKVENINVFIQPCNKNFNKNVWDNCAKIISKKTDDELYPYLESLFKWLQDLNWPGAFCILDRLQHYGEVHSLNRAYNICLKYAKAIEDSVWEENIRMLRVDKLTEDLD